MSEETPTVDALKKARDFHTRLRGEIGKVIVGQTAIIDQITVCLLSGGHALLVGAPGLAKTLLVRSVAQAMHLKFSRIQFTPDLMPADITGTTIIEEDQRTGHRAFVFRPGPVFANVILADEINRTPPRTQAALLESMQEHRITVGNESHTLEEPFFVLATQNPIEQEGTYPLPEAQLDRFTCMLKVDYPSKDEEVAILRTTTSGKPEPIQPLVEPADLIRMQAAVREVPCADVILQKTVDLIHSTRPNTDKAPKTVNTYVRWGTGPRASQHLVLAAKARAAIEGRYNVELEDIQALAAAVLRHRILLNYKAEADQVTTDDIIQELVERL